MVLSPFKVSRSSRSSSLVRESLLFLFQNNLENHRLGELLLAEELMAVPASKWKMKVSEALSAEGRGS